MEAVFLLLVMAGGLTAVVFGILWAVSLFVYMNQQPAVFARTAGLGVATIVAGTVGLSIANGHELEALESEYEAQIGVLEDELFTLQLKAAELQAENEELETAAAERERLEGQLEIANVKAEAAEEENRKLKGEIAQLEGEAEEAARIAAKAEEEAAAAIAGKEALESELAAMEIALSEAQAAGSAEEPAYAVTEVADETAAALAGGEPVPVFEDFGNCTELKTVYSGGVGQDHPAYQPAMDRDKDGWACE
ncbi:excalibur calcium-binding domain-containing protein [Indiicoccus explosivorum]|uniref:excalibur calcium-binding domain-containing protein n=1 Tax=Indiicoccus explosivorum TaxID=1917864 RepID=UPI000B444E99|nr:excalibur calcium-binding domain-containing protein [Indiicoccus explosivorum]